MIPLRDVIPSRTTPYITVTLIVLNALAWFYELAVPEDLLPVFLQTYGVVPASFRAPTLVTSMFLHGSWSHVIGNMWFLWIFGDNIEDRLGHAGFVVFYLFCGMGAAVGHIMMEPYSMLPTIGASGAIAGVMGAYFVMYPHSRVLTLVPLFIFWEIVELPAIFLLGFWFLMQLFGAGIGSITPTSGAESGGIAFMAHIAGFALGALIVFVFRKSRQEPQRWA
jgi:membrane associated rhomboid family serine protease